jgi:pimeloyl-ACP methyl ester carboxylesterase
MDPTSLLHGLGGDVGFWEPEAAELADSFRVIVIDARGSGGSSSTPEGFGVDDLADDVIAVLDQAGSRVAHVVGFSMGGLTAQSLAARYPDRVDRLVLASTYAVMNPQSRMFLDAVQDVYRTGATSKQMFDLICPWLFSWSFLGEPANADWFDYPDDAADDQSLDDWSKLYAAQRSFDARAGLAQVEVPTLVVHGRQDRLVTATDTADLADWLLDARVETFAASGHLVNVEEPRRFLECVRSHLRDA